MIQKFGEFILEKMGVNEEFSKYIYDKVMDILTNTEVEVDSWDNQYITSSKIGLEEWFMEKYNIDDFMLCAQFNKTIGGSLIVSDIDYTFNLRFGKLEDGSGKKITFKEYYKKNKSDIDFFLYHEIGHLYNHLFRNLKTKSNWFDFVMKITKGDMTSDYIKLIYNLNQREAIANVSANNMTGKASNRFADNHMRLFKWMLSMSEEEFKKETYKLSKSEDELDKKYIDGLIKKYFGTFRNYYVKCQKLAKKSYRKIHKII